jgi:hypothetical protein
MSEHIHEFRPDRDSVARRKRMLVQALRDSFKSHGDDFAGFAMVAWDVRGNADSAFYADTGPIGESIVPMFVHDVLNRHVAVKTAARGETYPLTGDA